MSDNDGVALTLFLRARIAEDEAEPAHGTDRALAECAAKKVIVQYGEGLRMERTRDSETDAQYRSVWWVMYQIATAYKGHPDYHEDWDL